MLRKLSTTKVSRSTVVNILRENQIDLKTDPTKGTWADFLKAHGRCGSATSSPNMSSPQREFASALSWHSSTCKPDAAWMRTQVDGFLAHAKAQGLEPGVVLRDRDSKYTAAFDGTLAAGGAAVKPVGFRSPNQNAYIERFVQAIERECLDKFIVFERGST